MKRELSAIAFGVALVFSGAGTSFAATKSATDTSAAASEHPVADSWITTKVKTELATTEGIKSGDIDVTTKNGLVTLSGNVASKAQVQKAIAVAKNVNGVRNVDATGLKSRD